MAILFVRINNSSEVDELYRLPRWIGISKDYCYNCLHSNGRGYIVVEVLYDDLGISLKRVVDNFRDMISLEALKILIKL